MSLKGKFLALLLIHFLLCCIFFILLSPQAETDKLLIFALLVFIIEVIFYLTLRNLIFQKIHYLTKTIKEFKGEEKDTKVTKTKNLDEIEYISVRIREYLKELREKISDIEEKQRIYELIAEKSEEIIIIFNKQGEIIYSNPKALEYFGNERFKLSEQTIPTLIEKFLSSEEELTAYREITLSDGTVLNAWIIPIEGISKTFLLIAHDITYFRKEKERLFEIATKDPLTSLFNRKFFEDLIQEIIEAVKKGQPYSLIFIDMDDLKKINDQFGHITGDSVIRAVSHTIKKSLRADDFAGRWGGDEFIVVIQGGQEKSKIVAERIQTNLSKISFNIGSHSFTPSVSIGITTVKATDTIESLIERADKATYRAKKKGKGMIELS